MHASKKENLFSLEFSYLYKRIIKNFLPIYLFLPVGSLKAISEQNEGRCKKFLKRSLPVLPLLMNWQVQGWALKCCTKDCSFKRNQVNSSKTGWKLNYIQVSEGETIAGTMSSIPGLEQKHNDKISEIYNTCA